MPGVDDAASGRRNHGETDRSSPQYREGERHPRTSALAADRLRQPADVTSLSFRETGKFLWGGRPRPRRTPGPAPAESTNAEEADGGVGCGPGGPPHKTNPHISREFRT